MTQQTEGLTDRLWEDLETALSAGNRSQVMRILFATDGSPEAGAARQLLALLPLPPGSAIRVVTVAGETDGETPRWMKAAQKEWGRRVAERAAVGLARDGVAVSISTPGGEVAEAILRAAEEFDADLVVVGSQGLTGLEGFLLGSVARNVAKHTRRPVLIARAPGHGLRRVVLAVDESKHAAQAANLTARLPLPAAAEIVAVNVARAYDPYPGLIPDDPVRYQAEVETVRRQRWEAARKLAEGVRGRLEAAGKQVMAVVREGDPASEILKLAEEQEADLIVAGARGVSLIKGLIVGSVADRLLKTAHCSLLLVR